MCVMVMCVRTTRLTKTTLCIFNTFPKNEVSWPPEYNEQPCLFHQWIFASLTDSLRNISNTYWPSQSQTLTPLRRSMVQSQLLHLNVPLGKLLNTTEYRWCIHLGLRRCGFVASTFVPMIYYHCASAVSYCIHCILLELNYFFKSFFFMWDFTDLKCFYFNKHCRNFTERSALVADGLWIYTL